MNSTYHAPVFLGASSEEERKLVRTALASHPRFFTSHLPADDEPSVRRWAEAMAGAAFSRRPVWLSEAAFGCMDELRRFLPCARFVRVVQHAGGESESVLEVSAERLRQDLAGEVERIFAFLGEPGVGATAGHRRCA